MEQSLLPPKKKRPLMMVTEVERGMPRSDSAEDGVLSCFLQNPKELLGNFQEVGKEEWFYHGSSPHGDHVGNRLVFTELMRMFDEGKVAIDTVTFAQHLIDRGCMDKIGGPVKISELLNFVPTPAHYPYYCGILRDKHLLRETIRNAEEIKQKTYEGEEGIKMQAESIVANASAIINLFQEQEKEQTLSEQIESWHQDFEERARGKKTSYMPTRWGILNIKVGGLNEGMTLISGEYSAGKSVLLRNLMVDACLTQGRPGLLFSYETSIKRTISGLVCDVAGVRTEVVARPEQNKPSASEQKSITWALGKIASSKLKVIHQSGLSAEAICRRARAVKAKFGDVVVAVDYLQKIPRPAHIEKNANQERELAVNSDTLQKGAADTGCPFIVACQLNEGGTARGSKSINMDGDIHYRIEGAKGIFVEKYKEGERNYHLPIFLSGSRLRFEEKEPQESFPN